MQNSKIEWCQHTFNSWWGCVKVSPGCQHCYAETASKRYGYDVWGKTAERRFFGEAHWREPLKWDKVAREAGEHHRVFCSSMADVFEDRLDLVPWRLRLFALIDVTPNLDWLLLTKRPENIKKLLPGDWLEHPRKNVWLGTTVEDQAMADKRIPELLDVPAMVRFLSCEPLLGPIDFTDRPIDDTAHDEFGDWSLLDLGIHWVICGGESGHGARPMHPDWARSLRDQCQASGVAFHFKQWGEYGPDFSCHSAGENYAREMVPLRLDGSIVQSGERIGDAKLMGKLGKKKAGRLLDGIEWNEYPIIKDEWKAFI